jgi:hypothetical protein
MIGCEKIWVCDVVTSSGIKGQRSSWTYSDTPSTSFVLRNQKFAEKIVLGRVKVFCEEVSKSRHFQLTQVRTRLDTIYERLCVRE